MTSDQLIDQWRRGLRIAHRAHYEAAKYYQRLHLMLGIPTLIISTLFGTSVFANLQYSDVAWIKFALAVLSLAMIVLSALQTFLRYSERSERHRTAAVQLGEVRRELEQSLVFRDKQGIDEATMKALREKWDAVDRQAPTVPTAIYNQTERQVGEAEFPPDRDSQKR